MRYEFRYLFVRRGTQRDPRLTWCRHPDDPLRGTIMVQSTLALGPAFKSHNFARSRSLKVASILRAEPTLVEMSDVPPPTRRESRKAAGTIRAFRVQGDDLNRDGLFEGDYVLVADQTRAR